MWCRIFLFLIVFAFQCGPAVAQSRKAVKYYEKARAEASNQRFEEALAYLQKSLKASPDYMAALELTADIYQVQQKADKAIHYYQQALSAKEVPFLHYKLALAAYGFGRYEMALDHFQYYKQQRRALKSIKKKAERYIASCRFALEAMRNPVPYEPTNLGDSINTDELEYLPSLSTDGHFLVFTHRKTSGDKIDEDFYYSERIDGAWSAARKMEGYLNTSRNEGAQCISADGKTLFFTSCWKDDGYGSCDLYYSAHLGDGYWSQPRNLGPLVNSEHWDSQPSIAADGKTLYFISNRPGGRGDTDIWKTTLNSRGEWSKPENLGSTINTAMKEESPFMHWDNQTLYFASQGHMGMGGTDFFMSRSVADTAWTRPHNLGYPVNTSADEFSLIVAADGKTGYFASDHIDHGQGGMDLYTFQLPEESRAIEVAYVKGRVLNSLTSKGKRVSIEVADLHTGERFVETTSDENGHYFITLPVNKEYALNIVEKDYQLYSEHFSLRPDANKAFQMNIKLQPIRIGGIIALKNIFYETNSYALKSESFAELNKVLAFLKANPTVHIEVSGHTDNKGSDALNKKLSQNRALSVFNYLKEKGIDEKRLSYKGYGASEPVASNDTEEGRQLNRRTELKIIRR